MGNARCWPNSFYTAEGIKLRDGDAIYVKDGQALRVVAGRAGPAEISVHELPQGGRLNLPGIISAPLSIDHETLKGCKGRARLDVDRLRGNLEPQEWCALLDVATRNIPTRRGRDKEWSRELSRAYLETTTPVGMAYAIQSRRGVLAALPHSSSSA